MRIASCLTALFLAGGSFAADMSKELAKGSIDDETLQKEAPAGGVIATQKDLDKLAKAWKIEAPKVDFAKELVIVGTWKGSSFGPRTTVTNGDLKVTFSGTKDLRPGFRFHFASFPREGVKTVNGKELAKE